MARGISLYVSHKVLVQCGIGINSGSKDNVGPVRSHVVVVQQEIKVSTLGGFVRQSYDPPRALEAFWIAVGRHNENVLVIRNRLDQTRSNSSKKLWISPYYPDKVGIALLQ